MRTRRKKHGFSLVELIVVIAIFSVLAGIAAPAVSRWVPRHRLKAAARDIVSVMAQAKAEAIRRGEQVTLAFNYQNADNPKLLSGRQLYVMFMDKGTDSDKTGARNAVCDDGEEILMQSGPVSDSIVFTAGTSMSFNNRGLPVGKTGAPIGGEQTIRLCVAKGETCRTVKVAPGGRVRTELQ